MPSKTENIGGTDYQVIYLNFSTPGNHLKVYSCGQCGGLVIDPELHSRWHTQTKANAMGFGAVL